MSCPQSLLEQLLSQPHDEALKVLSAWRANYAGNKRMLGNPTSNIAYGDPPSVSKYDPKVYEQVFRPPPPMHRDAEKLYGRKFLLRHHPDQYRVLLSNYGEVGKWFAKVDSIGDLRNNLERKNHVLSIIRDKINNLKDIVIDGAFYPWKEEDIYSWCIKSLASKRKYSKKKIDQSMSSSSGSIPINQDLDDEGVGDLHEKVTDLHQDAPLDKTIENAQDDNDLVKLDDMGAIMVHEKEKEEEKSAHEDVEVYIPEIPWENNNDQNDAYEEYQKFIRDESFGVALKVKDSCVIPHDDDHNYVKNKEMKDDTSSELCDVNIDLSSRKSARKRKSTSKLLELLKKKEKVLGVSKNKNKKELPRESRESTIQSSSLETKARDLCLGDKEAILMKWLETKRVEDIYPLIKPTYIALKKTHSFFKRKMCDTNSSTMCEDLVAWLLIENIVCINFDKVGPLSLKDVELTNEE
ncbi:hypothetical protein L7F22_044992 [Adiantum nelumboides]|nr:hypothetical protein [Adiantum nelumboides]